MIGKTVAHYELEDRLGEGGSGTVYRGRDLRLDRPVAIKVLADSLRDDELAWGRLLREARLASQLNHPHIAAIYDLGEDDGRAYIIMEFVDGLALSDLITDGGMAISQVQRYGVQIAMALAYAHEHGTVHGDLKGSNIVVNPEGNIKLLDFGLGRRIPTSSIAEVTRSNSVLEEDGATAGTLPYLAPEVLRGGNTSVQSDIWALGVLLYQMASGKFPFQGSTPFELSLEIMMGVPQNLAQLPEPLQSVVKRCLEKEPAARFSRASDVITALEKQIPQANANSQTAATEVADPKVARSAATAGNGARSRRTVWLGSAFALCLLISSGVYARHAWLSRHAAQQAAVVTSKPPKPASPVPAAAPEGAATSAAAIRVWVNTDSGTYHCPGSRWYGKTHVGQYMTQGQARGKGYHPAAKRACT